MKYGIIWFEKSENLGDDIQAYAASKYLPRIDYFVEREHLDDFIPKENEMVAVIMNGWYFYSHLNWPPSAFIFPLPISMHFDVVDATVLGRNLKDNLVVNGCGGDWLRRWGPIGARDNHTMKLLEENNIDVFFSGCMTLTLERFPNVVKHNEIIAVDVPSEVVNYIKAKTKRNIIIRTHKMELKKLSLSERLAQVENRLKEYQGADFVVTTRLHAALPCLALEVPVLYIKTWNENDRIETYLPYLNYIDIGEIEKYDFQVPLKNNGMYKTLSESLKAKCINFVKKAEAMEKSLSARQVFEDCLERNNRLKEIILRENGDLVLNEKFLKYQ